MGKIGNYKLEEILEFTGKIPNVTVHYNGNVHIAEYRPTPPKKSHSLHISTRMDIDQYYGWMKKVRMEEYRLQSLPQKKDMEALLRDGQWS